MRRLPWLLLLTSLACTPPPPPMAPVHVEQVEQVKQPEWVAPRLGYVTTTWGNGPRAALLLVSNECFLVVGFDAPLVTRVAAETCQGSWK